MYRVPDDKQVLGLGEGAGANILIRYSVSTLSSIHTQISILCLISRTTMTSACIAEDVASYRACTYNVCFPHVFKKNPGTDAY